MLETMEKRGKFVTIEGVEGAGKSSALDCIAAFLKQNNIAYHLTREPGGTEVAEFIRKLLLDHHTETITPDAELLLFFAARSQHVEHIIKPQLANNKWVISDRFTDASFAYQGGGRGVPLHRISQLEEWIVGDLKPDRIFLLDLPIDVGLQRVKQRGVADRLEIEQRSFFLKTREVYLTRAEKFPDQYRVIDASQPQEQVLKEIVQQLQFLISSDI